MKIPDTIRNLTPEVMEAYLNGQLTDAQRHQVEKLMLEDDFTSEAMEGLESMEAAARSESISSLQSRLETRIQPKGKSRAITWYAVAAAFVILISATYLLVRNPADVPVEGPAIAAAEDSDVEPLAMNEPPAETEESLEDITPGESPESATQKKAKEETITAQSLAEAEETEFNDSVGLELGDVSPERLSQIDAVAMDTMGVIAAIPSAAAELDKTQSASGRIRGETLPANAQRLAGQVVLQDGMPVSNADVLIDGTPYQTDADGYFELNVANDDEIVFSLMGLEKKELTSEEKASEGTLSIVMDQEAATLSELMVSATPAERISTRGARPAVSEEVFRKYLEDNRITPEVDEAMSGIVVIRVTIEIDGTISNTKIIRSLGEPYDVEAIRLIREGPGWEPALKKGLPVKDKVRVKVSF